MTTIEHSIFQISYFQFKDHQVRNRTGILWFERWCYVTTVRSSHPRCPVKKLFLKTSEISQENNCVGVSFNNVAGLNANNFIKKKLQLFFCEIYEIFKNTYFEEHLRTTAYSCNTDYLIFDLQERHGIQVRIQNPVKHQRWSVLAK